MTLSPWDGGGSDSGRDEVREEPIGKGKSIQEDSSYINASDPITSDDDEGQTGVIGRTYHSSQDTSDSERGVTIEQEQYDESYNMPDPPYDAPPAYNALDYQHFTADSSSENHSYGSEQLCSAAEVTSASLRWATEPNVIDDPELFPDLFDAVEELPDLPTANWNPVHYIPRVPFHLAPPGYLFDPYTEYN